MTAKLTPQTRVLAVLGIVLVVAFAAMMVIRGGLLGSSSSEDAALPVQAPTKPDKGGAATTPRAAKPAVTVLPGVPTPVAGALQRSKVVVAALVGGSTVDRVRVAQARAGAKSVGAAFVTIDVRKEPQAKAMQSFMKTGSDATVLVVRRPGKIANSFSSYADQAIIAQAAVNAGAKARAAVEKAPKKATAAAVKRPKR